MRKIRRKSIWRKWTERQVIYITVRNITKWYLRNLSRCLLWSTQRIEREQVSFSFLGFHISRTYSYSLLFYYSYSNCRCKCWIPCEPRGSVRYQGKISRSWSGYQCTLDSFLVFFSNKIFFIYCANKKDKATSIDCRNLIFFCVLPNVFHILLDLAENHLVASSKLETHRQISSLWLVPARQTAGRTLTMTNILNLVFYFKRKTL